MNTRISKIASRVSGILFSLLTSTFLLGATGCGVNGARSVGEQEQSAEHQDEHGHVGHEEAPSEIVLASASLQSMEVETIQVREAPVGATLEFPGRVVPVSNQEAMVTALLDGRIEQVFVNEGDRVRAGEPVAVVTGPLLGDLVAELRHTRADLNRQERLSERGVGIEKNLIQAKTAYDAARQHLRAMGLSPEEIEEVATGTHDAGGVHLRAPITGVVLNRRATLGGPVAPGDILFHIAHLTPIWVEADVYERDLPLIREGMDVQVQSVSRNGGIHEGTIRQIVPNVDRERRVSTVRVQLANDGEALKPGMYATVAAATAGEVVPSLPVDAILTDGSQSYVIVAVNDSTFRQVEVGAAVDAAGTVAVPELPVGTRVVTTGAFQIHSAMQGVEAGHAH